MPSLLLVCFVIQVVVHLISTVGSSAVNSFLWSIWNKLPTGTSADYKSAVELRREVVRLKRELQATSAQDQFAKWAKVQRQHDKAMADYDKKAQGLKDFESTFNKVVNALRWLGVQGLRFLLQTYYQKTPMYWLPRGWVPYWGEWLLSFPRAPVGSVSIQVWFGACMAVTQIATSAVAAVWALRIQKEGTAETKAKGEPMKVGGRSAMEKKEL